MSRRKMLSSGFVRAGGLLMGLANSVLIARLSSAELLGLHALWMAMIGWSVSIGQFGFRTWIIREVANRRLSVKGILKAGALTAGFSIGISPFFFIVFRHQLASSSQVPILILLILFVAFAAVKTVTGSLVSANKGIGNIALSEFSEGVVGRAILAGYLLFLGASGTELTLLWLVVVVLFGGVVGLLISSIPIVLSRFFTEISAPSSLPKLATIVPFWGISLSNLFAQRIDMLVLGWFASPEMIGFYRIANSLVLALSGIHESAKNSVLGVLPHWTSHPEMRASVRKRVKQVVKLSTALVALGTIVLIIGGKYLLTSIWGGQFVAAYGILVVLLVSKLLSTSAGPVGMAATLNGLEVQSNVIFWVAAIANAAASTVLINFIGGTGVAIGTLLSNVLFNGMLLLLLNRRLSFNTTAFA